MCQDFRAGALPPLRPAAFFCAVVPPCFELERELDDPDFLPPRLDEPGEFEILAARSFDMPFLRSPSYCFSFLTPGRLFGMGREYPALATRNEALTDMPGVRPRTCPNRTTGMASPRAETLGTEGNRVQKGPGLIRHGRGQTLAMAKAA
jgi:hypothetical protein